MCSVVFFFRLDFEAVATADMYMRLHVMLCFVLCSSNCRKINLCRSCLRCSYPPCSGCGLNGTWESKRKDLKEVLWFCRKCFGQAAETKQQHPPCSGCGANKPRKQRNSAHALMIQIRILRGTDIHRHIFINICICTQCDQTEVSGLGLLWRGVAQEQ